MRVVFGHLWGLRKDLKISKTLRPYVFRETGTNSSRDQVIFGRLRNIFERQAGSFVKTIFGFAWYLCKSFNHAYCTIGALKLIKFRHCVTVR
ncbi:hypothetical protein BYT27DRAFT_7317632 [Phlegmacium glaucopus]|nr:hypothetical protein BYT27DRAFT_7317632 [Phlegmacium glaucopus]